MRRASPFHATGTVQLRKIYLQHLPGTLEAPSPLFLSVRPIFLASVLHGCRHEPSSLKHRVLSDRSLYYVPPPESENPEETS